MRMLHRKAVNKKHAVKKFRRHVSHTKGANVQAIPMRGGFRL